MPLSRDKRSFRSEDAMRMQRRVETAEQRSERRKVEAQVKNEAAEAAEAKVDRMIRQSIKLYGP